MSDSKSRSNLCCGGVFLLLKPNVLFSTFSFSSWSTNDSFLDSAQNTRHRKRLIKFSVCSISFFMKHFRLEMGMFLREYPKLTGSIVASQFSPTKVLDSYLRNNPELNTSREV